MNITRGIFRGLFSPNLPAFSLRATVAGGMVVITAAGIATWLTYRAAFENEREHLADIVDTQSALIEAVARYDRRAAATSLDGTAGTARAATLGQVREALRNHTGLGETGELELGDRTPEGEIQILVHQRHEPGTSARHSHVSTQQAPPALKRALNGESGTGVVTDASGTTVLAAYAPLPELGMGLVAKKDLAEIRMPYITAALQTIGLALLLVMGAALAGHAALRPLLRRLQEQNEIMQTLAGTAPGMVFRAPAQAERPLDLAGDGARGLTGRAPETLTQSPGYSLSELTHPNDRARVAKTVQQALAADRDYQVAYRLHTIDGETRWVQEYGRPSHAGSRRVVYGILFDITASHEAVEERERLSAVLDASPDFVGMADTELRPLYVNRGGRRLVGLDERAPLPYTSIEPFAPAWANETLKTVAFPQAARTGYWQGDLALLTVDGHELPVSQVILAHRDADGELVRYSTVARDISERRQLEEALDKQRHEFRNVVRKANTGMVVVNAEGIVLFTNPAAQRMLNRSEAELHDAPLGIPVVGTGVSEVQIPSGSGRVHTAEIAVTETQWDDQPAYLAMLHDITDRREAEAALEHMAYHDTLTGLPNRTLLSQRVGSALAEARVRGTKLAVLFVDLDHFKTINDSLGHDTGDRLLTVVAERLQGVVRRSDTVARVGGDEFALLLEGIDDEDVPVRIGEKIRAALEQPIQLDDRELVTECSIGVSIYPTDGDDTDALIRRADTAMYAAKHQGRNLVNRYSEAQGASVDEELRTRTRLRQALDEREFVLFYQPQLDLQSEGVIGHEALLRWRHPERGLLGPDTFMAALEDTGLIEAVGAWALREGFTQAARWSSTYPGAVMSINLAAHQLRHGQVVETVLGAIHAAGLEPQRAALEITESTAITNLEHTRRVLSRLRQEGVCIMLDDFGTGYSSLKYLQQLPVDIVKIDKGFVQALPRPDAVSLTRAIISMAHSLGLGVLAEGVETAEQAAFLREADCEYVQGFFYGRPAPAEPPAGDQPVREQSLG